jgi:hypothetical protein
VPDEFASGTTVSITTQGPVKKEEMPAFMIGLMPSLSAAGQYPRCRRTFPRPRMFCESAITDTM